MICISCNDLFTVTIGLSFFTHRIVSPLDLLSLRFKDTSLSLLYEKCRKAAISSTQTPSDSPADPLPWSFQPYHSCCWLFHSAYCRLLVPSFLITHGNTISDASSSTAASPSALMQRPPLPCSLAL
jgi:hypothetical protein